MNLDLTFSKWFHISLIFWALSSFSSISLMGLTQILYIIPIFYFTIKYLKGLSKSNFFLILFCVIAVISVLVNWDNIPNPLRAATRVKHTLMGFLLIEPLRYYLKSNFVHSRVRLVLNIYLLVLVIATCSDLYGQVFGMNLLRQLPSRADGRLAGLFGQTMTYSYLIQFICISLVGVLFNKKTLMSFFNKRVFYIAFLFSHIGLIGSRSRGAYIGYIVGLLALIFFKNKKLFKKLLILVVSFFTVVIFIVFSGGMKSNLLQKWNSDSNMTRISQYRAALIMFKNKLFLGYGYNTFQDHSVKIKKDNNIPFYSFKSHAHNNYLEVLSTTGIIGFVFFCLWQIFWVMDLIRWKGVTSQISLSIFAAFFVSGQFQNTLTDSEVMFFFMMLYAFTQAMLPKKDNLKA